MGNKKIKTFLAAILIFFSFSFFQVKPASAAIPVIDAAHILVNKAGWIDSVLNTVENTVFELFDYALRYGLQLIKKEMIDQVNNKMVEGFMTGGPDGKPLFVTNWQQYLYQIPQDFAKDYINTDFVDKLSGNRCSGAGAASDYYNYLCNESKLAVAKLGINTDLPNYTSGDPTVDMFTDGDLRAFSMYFECGNNPYCTTQTASDLYDQIAAQKKEESIELANGDGVLSVTNDNGTVDTPSVVLKDSLTNALTMGQGVVVNATTYPEVAPSFFSNMLLQQLNQGFNSFDKALDKKLVEIDFTRYGL